MSKACSNFKTFLTVILNYAAFGFETLLKTSTFVYRYAIKIKDIKIFVYINIYKKKNGKENSKSNFLRKDGNYLNRFMARVAFFFLRKNYSFIMV